MLGFETKKDLRNQRDNAERRALTHFRKLNKIENIIKNEEAKKTPAVFIVDKIKEVIVGQTNNFLKTHKYMILLNYSIIFKRIQEGEKLWNQQEL